MKYSGVGGQAVMEGVMMKNEDRYAVAVRKPDHTIDVKVSTFKETIKNKKLRRLPFIRGVINFIESLILGMQTLMYSASFFEDDEDEKKKKEAMTQEERKAQEEKEKKQEKAASCFVPVRIRSCIILSRICFHDGFSEKGDV